MLSELFSKEELDEENRLALGEQTYRTIQEVELCHNNITQKWDIQNNSDESSNSNTPSFSERSLVMYKRVKDIHRKIKQYKFVEKSKTQQKIDTVPSICETTTNLLLKTDSLLNK